MKNKALLYIIIAGLLWGTSAIFVHYLSPYGLTSMQMTAIRGVVSLFAIGIYLVIYNKSFFVISLSDLPLCAGAGFSMFLTACCYYSSMQLTSVSTSVVLMYTAPIFVMCYSVIFMKERLTKIKLISVVCVFVGCGLVSGVIGGLKYDLFGMVMGLISGIAYSAYNIITKVEMCRKVNPLSATFYCYVFMALFAVLTSSPFDMNIVTMKNFWILALLMVGLGICTSVLPYFLYTLGLKELPAGTASSLGVIEPLAATVYSVLLLGERLTLYSVIGITLILSAVFMLSRTE